MNHPNDAKTSPIFEIDTKEQNKSLTDMPFDITISSAAAGEEIDPKTDEILRTLTEVPEDEPVWKPILKYGGIILAALLIGAAVALLISRLSGRKKKKPAEAAKSEFTGFRTGVIQNPGARSEQQDSCGVQEYPGGILAVVADGMGGLKDGDKVSRQIVMTMLRDAEKLTGANSAQQLYPMLAHALSGVNTLLGDPGKFGGNSYSSGSTVVAVLAEYDRMQWISVGDSRIYLWRGGTLLQLNREHNYRSELFHNAVNNRISFQDILNTDEKMKVKLTSFVGMGALKYLDGSMRPAAAVAGDKLLVMSDGVYNTVSEDELAAILNEFPDPQAAADAIKAKIVERALPKQDNFTAVIVEIGTRKET